MVEMELQPKYGIYSAESRSAAVQHCPEFYIQLVEDLGTATDDVAPPARNLALQPAALDGLDGRNSGTVPVRLLGPVGRKRADALVLHRSTGLNGRNRRTA